MQNKRPGGRYGTKAWPIVGCQQFGWLFDLMKERKPSGKLNGTIGRREELPQECRFYLPHALKIDFAPCKLLRRSFFGACHLLRACYDKRSLNSIRNICIYSIKENVTQSHTRRWRDKSVWANVNDRYSKKPHPPGRSHSRQQQ